MITFACCQHNYVDTKKLTAKIWVNSDIKFDTLWFDTLMYIVHGSGTLLLFDSTKTFKSLSNDFYLVDDSVAWGEPLANFKLGSWTSNKENITTTQTYIQGSATELLGKHQTDTFFLRQDTLITNTNKKYIQVRLLTKELTETLNRRWPDYNEKNGM